MKKSFLVAAIAAAVAAPAANAGVVLYGKIHASIDYTDNSLGYYGNGSIDYTDYSTGNGGEPGSFDWSSGGSLPELSGKAWYVTNRASRIGFKGTEDLGNGLSLIWKAETTYNLTEGGNGWGSGRNAYIGLTGDWGTFLYGRHDTPYKISTGKLDLFSDTAGDYNASTAFGSLASTNLFGFEDLRAPNAIAYISPNWNGLTVAGAVVAGESPSTGDDGLADSYSVAAMYSNNGLYLSAAYEDTHFNAVGFSAGGDTLNLPGTKNKWRVGAGYTMNAFHVGFVYEDRDADLFDGISGNAQVWQVSGSYTFGNNVLKAAYGQSEADSVLVNEPDAYAKVYGEQTQWTVGLDHKLSKRTTAYILYTAQDAKLGAQAEADLNINFGSLSIDGIAVEGGLEADNSTFSMGLIHNF